MINRTSDGVFEAWLTANTPLTFDEWCDERDTVAENRGSLRMITDGGYEAWKPRGPTMPENRHPGARQSGPLSDLLGVAE